MGSDAIPLLLVGGVLLGGVLLESLVGPWMPKPLATVLVFFVVGIVCAAFAAPLSHASRSAMELMRIVTVSVWLLGLGVRIEPPARHACLAIASALSGILLLVRG